MNIFNRTDSKTSLYKTLFTNQALSGDFENLQQTSSNLENNSYELVSIILRKDQKNLEKFLQTNKIEIDFVLYLIQHEFCIEYAVQFLNNIKVRDYLYFICLKELLIKNFIEIDVDKMLENIDDFGIYKYCIEHKIRPKPRDTINYEYYKIHMKEFDGLNNLLEKVKVYEDIEYILKISGATEHTNYLVDSVIKFLNNGFDEEFCKTVLKSEKVENGLVKLVLAHLISTKDIRNLVLALYIARKYAFSVIENYEVDLIYLFLLKYFLFYREVLDVYKKLDIKNNQMLNMSYIWSDVYLNLHKTYKLNNREMKLKFRDYIDDVKSTIRTSLPSFIDANKISYALNLIDLYKKVENNVVLEELDKGSFVKSGEKCQFKNYLGNRCAYLFDKNREFYSVTYPEGDLFKNDVMDIKDEEFKEWFTSNKELYN